MLQQMRSKTTALVIWAIIAVVFVGTFVFAQTSGLLGRGPVTTTSVVAKVNGREISYTAWANASAAMAQQQEQQQGRGLTLDERRQVDEQAFNQMVGEILMQQEYVKRGIKVTDEEIIQMAQAVPPPQFQQLPDLQTDGRFDPSKYKRFLASPAARQQGILLQLEQYYRTEIPRQKLFSQLAGDAYVSDTRLWLLWRDTHDSATVSFVAYHPTSVADFRKNITDADIQKYYDTHKSEFERPGSAVISLVTISRQPTAADSAEALRKILAVRAEIAKGAKFEDVAKRESEDTISGSRGGDLGKAVRSTYVKEFSDAAFKVPVGALSEPVKTQFGYHILRVDKRIGDSVWAHHILKLAKQGDSAAAISDKSADRLAKIAAGSDQPAKFDSAARELKLLSSRIPVREGEAATYLGRQVPSVSAWAFGGAKVGESSELFDDDAGYYMARLDSIHAGGVQPLATVKDEVRDVLAREKAVDALVTRADSLSRAAAKSTLEDAAKAHNEPVKKEGPFARSSTIPALGFSSQAIGAAFTLPVGAVSAPVRTEDGAYVMRVDKRVTSDTAKWAAQKTVQRMQVMNSMREQKVRIFLDNLRKAAKIDDRRKQIQAAQRRQTPT